MPPSPAAHAANGRGPAEGDERFFPEEGPAGGCASGECLPEAPAAPGPQAPRPAPAAARPPPPAPAPPAGEAPSSSPSSYQASRWRAAVEAVKAASARHGASLAHARLLTLRAGSVSVGFTRETAFHRTAVSSPTGKALVERALSEHFGQPTSLAVEASDVQPEAAGPSLAETDARERSEYERSTGGQVRNHPAVLAALRLLGGEVEHVQVLERERPVRPPDGPEDPA